MKKIISCPHCGTNVEFKKGFEGRVVGTIAGGGVGYGLASGLGIAGAIAGAAVAIPATLVGVGLFAIIGSQVGKKYDNSIKCPNCGENLIL